MENGKKLSLRDFIINMFKPGQTVVLKEEHRKNPAYMFISAGLYCFLFEHSPQVGHCTLLSISGHRTITMVHTDILRLAREDEC
jgi:hypothetical protein